MVIDGGNAVPEGLNLNYFKVYYGKRFGPSTSGPSASYVCVIMCNAACFVSPGSYLISFPKKNFELFGQESYFLTLIFINGCRMEMVSRCLNLVCRPCQCLCISASWNLLRSFLSSFLYLGIMWLGSWCVDGKHPGCDQTYFGRREFSFTLENDIYLRFQSFNSASELENSIKEKCPVKIDIGPVYSVDVRISFFLFLIILICDCFS